MTSLSIDRFKQEILVFLDETTENVHGIYLDKGTSLFETLAAMTPEEASSRACETSASPAAHARHVLLYWRTLQAILRGEAVEKVNWREIWENDRPVSASEWAELVAELRRGHAETLRLLNDPATWERDDAIGDSMAVVTHTAFHLGSIRHALQVIRHRGSGANAGIGRQPKP